MPDSDTDPGAYVGSVVYDATGTRLGTVAAVADDGSVLYVDPDPDPTEETWAAVGGGEYVNYDNDWFGVPDYTVWSETDPADTDIDEWPYTIEPAEIEAVDGDGIYLESTSLTELVRDVVPFLDSE